MRLSRDRPGAVDLVEVFQADVLRQEVPGPLRWTRRFEPLPFSFQPSVRKIISA